MNARHSLDAVRRAIFAARRVVFDFDGTLVDSNEIKRSGFDRAFAEYPEHMKEIQAYCHGFNHTIRGEKFRYVTETILGLEYTAEREKTLHRLYSQFTTDGVASAREIPGASVFVRSLSRYRPALVSSTPHDILLEILDRRGWRSMFDEIQGSPVDKREWLIRFQESLGCRPEELLFFGDTNEDAESARQAGCTFVRVNGDSQHNGELALRDFTFLSFYEG